MNIFGVGPLEIVFVILIGILVLGPEGMVEAGRKLGKFMRSVVTSGWWKSLQNSVNEVQNLPYRLMREAELDEWNEIYKIDEEGLEVEQQDPPGRSSWRGPASPSPTGNDDQDQAQTEEDDRDPPHP